jgi:hypothetical protein
VKSCPGVKAESALAISPLISDPYALGSERHLSLGVVAPGTPGMVSVASIGIFQGSGTATRTVCSGDCTASSALSVTPCMVGIIGCTACPADSKLVAVLGTAAAMGCALRARARSAAIAASAACIADIAACCSAREGDTKGDADLSSSPYWLASSAADVPVPLEGVAGVGGLIEVDGLHACIGWGF